jgi:hypothetical protein
MTEKIMRNISSGSYKKVKISDKPKNTIKSANGSNIRVMSNQSSFLFLTKAKGVNANANRIESDRKMSDKLPKLKAVINNNSRDKKTSNDR